MKIILASASPRRRELLEQIGMEFEVITSDVEEVYTSTEPEEIVKELALLKAFDVAQVQEGHCVVIGADTVVVQDGKILGKPKSEEEAFEMLMALQGKDHLVYTGIAMIECIESEVPTSFTTEEELEIDDFDDEGIEIETTFELTNHAIGTRVYVMPMTEEQIREYIATGEPMDKAGAYGIQGRFAAHIEGIEGDYYNVVGLPVSYVYGRMQQIFESNK